MLQTTRKPIEIFNRVIRNAVGIPDCVQSRIKLLDSKQDLARYANIDMMYPGVPDEFAAMEEIRLLIEAVEERYYPKLYAIRKRREARMTNTPETRDYCCPLCGAENPEKIYTVPGEGAVGCDECLCAFDPYEWFENEGVGK